jgi:RNA polymerase sigma factor (sigma-70 family)
MELPGSDPYTVTSVLIVEDEPVFRRGLRAVFEAFRHQLTIVDEAASASEAVRLAQELVPDVVLFDLRLPQYRGALAEPSWEYGVAAIEQIAQKVPHTRILVLSYLEDSDILFAALTAGAHGYISKGDGYDGKELVDAIQKIVAGEVIYGPTIAQRIRDHYQRKNKSEEALEHLTPRERQVLDLLIHRKSNSDIAEKLVISIKTVKTHVSNILAKLQLERRQEIYWRARERGHDERL